VSHTGTELHGVALDDDLSPSTWLASRLEPTTLTGGTGTKSAACHLLDPPWEVTPSLVWPEDRAWCAAAEIDFDSTIVACSTECARALIDEPAQDRSPGSATERPSRHR
jgi:hypothetical protein